MVLESDGSNMHYRKVLVISGKGPGPNQFAQTLRGLVIDSGDRLCAVGDSDLRVFSLEGKLLQGWPTDRPGYSIAVGPEETIYVGQAGQVQTFDRQGKLLDTWRDPARMGLISAIGVTGASILLADVKDRCIRRYDRKGTFVKDIGKDNRMRGFMIPNQHLDFAIDPEGVIHAPNPGKHRVESYALDGKLICHFGRFGGPDTAGFGGCCNPTNIALTRQGRVVVTEKADPRVKVYDALGKLLAVMGEKDFDPACKNMDVAVDSGGRIYVADTVRLHVCVYAPEGADDATRPATAPHGETVKS
jgi:sugar lactone lactonase YvrE